MVAVGMKCAVRKDDEIRRNFNSWCDDIWKKKKPNNHNWFEATNHLLHVAFGTLVAAPTSLPPKPNPFVGTSSAAFGAELTAFSETMRAYAEELSGYAARVDACVSNQICRDATGTCLKRIENDLMAVCRIPNTQGNFQALCQKFSRWGKSYRVWSESFSEWEIALDYCLKNGRPMPPSIPTETQNKQVSPVPWPPWEDYADE
jgi:hypothetical protein